MNEYIPVATKDTIYYKPQSKQEMEATYDLMKVGDMIYNQWVFNGLWYTMGLNDKHDPTIKCLFPNIIMEETLPPLTRWGLERMHYLKENRKFMAAGLGTVGLLKHCLGIEKQAENRKRNMMTAIRKDPANLVTERDKAKDPISWAGRMVNFQHRVHETIYADLIYS